MPALGQVTLDTTLELLRLVREGLGVLGEEAVPLLLGSRAARCNVCKGALDRFGEDELGLGVEAELLLDVGDLLVAESLAVSGTRVLLARAKTDCRADHDERRCARVLARGLERVGNRRDLLGRLRLELGTTGVDDIPACSLEAQRDVLGETVVDCAVDRDLRFRVYLVPNRMGVIGTTTNLVAVVHENEVVERQVASDRDGCGEQHQEPVLRSVRECRRLRSPS